MNTDKLVTTGLSRAQAEAYALLIERGEVTPPAAATALKLTRTNAYKLLDKLVDLKLAQKVRDKKSVYKLSNPLALASLVANYRAEAVAREEAVSTLMNGLLATYYKHTEQPSVEVVSGKQAVADAYRKQISLHENLYFIHTDADVAMMGFDTMHEIRVAPVRHNNKRYGILTAPTEGPINYEQHKRSNLEITWAPTDAYNMPVEWSVTESSLLIVLYATEPHAILIADKIVAGAFFQLWHLLNGLLQQQPTHQALQAKPQTPSSAQSKQ